MTRGWTLRWLAMLVLFTLSTLAIASHADAVSTGAQASTPTGQTSTPHHRPAAYPSSQEVPPWQSHR